MPRLSPLRRKSSAILLQQNRVREILADAVHNANRRGEHALIRGHVICKVDSDNLGTTLRGRVFSEVERHFRQRSGPDGQIRVEDRYGLFNHNLLFVQISQ